MYRLAAGEESISDYLGRLSPGYIVARSEVWTACSARLNRSAARISLHYVSSGQPLYEVIECMRGRHVFERLPERRLGEARCIRDDL